MCACVCYRSSERYECFKSQSKVPKENTQRKEQNNVGFELKILGSKVEIFVWHLRQEIDASRSLVLFEDDYWYIKRCICVCKLHKLNWQLYSHSMYLVFYIVPCMCTLWIWLRHHVIPNIEHGTQISWRLCKRKTCKRNDLIVRTKCSNLEGVEYLNRYRGLNASGFTVEGPWQTRSIVSVEVVHKP